MSLHRTRVLLLCLATATPVACSATSRSEAYDQLLAEASDPTPIAEPIAPMEPVAPAPTTTPAPMAHPSALAISPSALAPARKSSDEGEARDDGRRPDRTGNWELTLFGSGVSNQDFDAGAFSGGGSIGYYLGDVVELAIRQNVAFIDAGDSDWNGSTRAAIDFHLPLPVVKPFIGANFGWVYGDTVKETMAAAPEAGVKIFAKQDVFIFAMAEYQFFFEDTDQAGDAFEDGSFVYSLGIGFTF